MTALANFVAYLLTFTPVVAYRRNTTQSGSLRRDISSKRPYSLLRDVDAFDEANRLVLGKNSVLGDAA